MTFSPYEESRVWGQPITLYFARYGSNAGDYFAYCDAEQPVTYAGVEYQPIPIQRTAISTSGTLDKSALSITMPHDLGLPELFRVYPPSQVVTMVIRQGHYEDPDQEYLVVWSGRILSCSRDVNEAKFTCEPVSTALRRSGLRRNYQFGCPHALYGPQCQANKAAATVSATVASVVGSTINLVPGWTVVDQMKYINGMVEWTDVNGINYVRSLLTHTVLDQYGVSGSVPNLGPGDTVSMVLGCNRQMSDCSAVHNNINNFGGQPWIPLKNPIGGVNNYY